MYSAFAWLARPVLLFYTLPWLLILLTLGTVSQRYIGLYHSEKLFFGSFILWIGPIPLPGAYAALTLIALSLIAKLALKSPIRKRSAGTIITHVSILLLLVGGLISALTREEGYITLFPNDTVNAVSDYHTRDLMIFKNQKRIKIIPYAELKKDATFQLESTPLSFTVKLACYPCSAEPLLIPNPQGYGMASTMKLVESLPNPDDALNRAGAMLEIKGTNNSQSGTYIASELLASPPKIIVGEDQYTIEMHAHERPLPFKISLKHFEQDNHPGTAMAKEYLSDVEVTDGPLKWTTRISMNEPLRYDGYTIYQSSFIQTEEKTGSVLTVVKNAGWAFPYISVATLCAGLLAHIYLRIKPAQAAAMIVLLISLTHAEPTLAADMPDFDYTEFSHIPILHEGRIKPMDSFARALLKGISGDNSFKDSTPSIWLAEVIFNPAAAAERPVFRIASPQLRQALMIQKQGTLYSFNELAAMLPMQRETIKSLMERDPKSLSDTERDLLRLFDLVNLYTSLSGSLTALSPMADLSPELRKELTLPATGTQSFQSLLKTRRLLMEKLKAIVKTKKSDMASYTPLEQEIANLAFQIDTRESMQLGNTLFRVIPNQWNDKGEWLSPWGVLLNAAGSPETGKLFTLWADMQKAWIEKDATSWLKTTTAMRETLLKAPGVRPQIINLEAAYNSFNPLGKAILAYAIAFSVALLAVILQRNTFNHVATGVMLIALTLHGGILLTRMLILGRPPVSTLYESMLFVSIITAMCGIYLSWKRAGAEGTLAGSLISISILLLSGVFAGDGDTLEMLTAVLNTNFWLGTHVICITMGYGFSLITGVLAHFYLFRRAMAAPQKQLADQYRLLHTLALIALCFTAIGTMLGGIWADQSWGRFWGWDPKENGALAIVLWLIWALHGRITGQMRETAFAVALSFTNIIVALAWVGVNLLSVGLHSYGFSSAAAWGLPAFCVGEIIIITILAMLSAQQYNVIRSSR